MAAPSGGAGLLSLGTIRVLGWFFCGDRPVPGRKLSSIPGPWNPQPRLPVSRKGTTHPPTAPAGKCQSTFHLSLTHLQTPHVLLPQTRGTHRSLSPLPTAPRLDPPCPHCSPSFRRTQSAVTENTHIQAPSRSRPFPESRTLKSFLQPLRPASPPLTASSITPFAVLARSAHTSLGPRCSFPPLHVSPLPADPFALLVSANRQSQLKRLLFAEATAEGPASGAPAPCSSALQSALPRPPHTVSQRLLCALHFHGTAARRRWSASCPGPRSAGACQQSSVQRCPFREQEAAAASTGETW